MNLFIIGNGFDLGHGMSTTYWDFREFLKTYHPMFLKEFESKYGFSGKELKTHLWSNIEYNLADLEEVILFERMYQSTDLGLDSGNVGIADTLKYHFRNEFNYIEKLTIYLKEWIELENQELDDKARRTSFIKENNHDIFLNFNYTTTLEDLYNIEKEKILHIHGMVNSNKNLVLGHSNSEQITYFLNKYREFKNIGDEQSSPIYEAFAEYCSDTYKDVTEHIEQLILSDLDFHSVKKIMIVGHSLSEVDLPYFEEIKRRVGKVVEWNIYYHGHGGEQKNRLKEKLKKTGVKEQQINMIPSSEFYDL